MKKTIVTLLSAATIAVAPSVYAVAVTSYPSGGTWEYSTDGSTIWSNYYHSKKSHGSSVRNCKGKLTRSPNVTKGKWANALRTDGCTGLGEIDQAYYRVL